PGGMYWFNDLEQYASARGPRFPWTNQPIGIYVCPSYARMPGAHWAMGGVYAYNVSGVAVPMTKGWGLGIGGQVLSFPAIPPQGYRANRESEVRNPSDMIGVGDGCL